MALLETAVIDFLSGLYHSRLIERFYLGEEFNYNPLQELDRAHIATHWEGGVLIQSNCKPHEQELKIDIFLNISSSDTVELDRNTD